MKSLTIIDTFGFFFRSFYALPPLFSKDGFPSGLLTGFIRFINKLQKDEDLQNIIFCIDSKEKSFRKDLFSQYKSNRAESPLELVKQLPVAIEWIEQMGFCHLERVGFEADDLIASIATLAARDGYRVKIISHDKDMYQLISKTVNIFDPLKNKIVDEEGCFSKFGVYPQDFINFQSLIGDTSDNIPGVKGIGPKTASALINKYKTLENIYEHIQEISPQKVKDLLVAQKDRAFLSRQLVSLKRDIFDSFDFSAARLPKNPFERIKHELQKYSITPPQGHKNTLRQDKKLPLKFTTVTDLRAGLALFESLDPNTIVAFDTETNSLDTKEAKIIGFSFAFDETNGYYVPIHHAYLGAPAQMPKADAKQLIERIFSFKVVGHNLKYDLGVLKTNFAYEPAIYCDTMIMAWLNNPSSNVGQDRLSDFFLNHKTIEFGEVVKKGEDFSQVFIDEATKYAAEDAVISLRLFNFFSKTLSPDLQEELFSVEIPFVKTLLDFEASGIKIDMDFLRAYDEDLQHAIGELEETIYAVAGTIFNINSTQQLGGVLFERLGLPSKRKTKIGYSTDEKTLTALEGAHPIIGKILEYREHYKLRSTYSLPILERAAKSGKIHTNFLHTGTATGRLSSKDPNLQNIPVKTDLGRKIRGAFCAGDGARLVSFDYSQIELRLLGHFSNDETLVSAFRANKDIHLETAVKIFGQERAKEKRNLAKSINFGLIYGMGSKKLSDEVGISAQEAREYIDEYFNSFPTVKNFLETQKRLAKERGFSQTLLGRKRFFDFANASAMFIAAFEREAVNTIFQGSAADLIKLSMNKIQALIAGEAGIRPILQIHDELIYEISEEKIEKYQALIKNTMQEVYQLNVPLVVNVSVGKRWDELK
ncbi:MAG: DNA polymerase I [Helicobacteraceae bacterium]